MKIVIYADVLVTLNIFVNYFLLLASGVLLRERLPRLRVLSGAAVGGVSSLTLLLPQMHPAASAALKLCALCATVLLAFGSSKLRAFLRRTLCFLAVNAGFAGAVFALDIALDGRGVLYGNGSFYIDISFRKLAVCVCAAYAVCAASSRILRRLHPRESMCTLTVGLFGKSVEMRALIDTGNSLREGFSGSRVAVVWYEEACRILPEGCAEFFGGVASLGELPSALRGRVRLIPCATVGGGGVLPAFRADEARVLTDAGEADLGEIYIAVTPVKLSDEYSALVPTPNIEIKNTKRCANEKNRRADERSDIEGETAAAGRRSLLHQRSADASSAADKG